MDWKIQNLKVLEVHKYMFNLSLVTYWKWIVVQFLFFTLLLRALQWRIECYDGIVLKYELLRIRKTVLYSILLHYKHFWRYCDKYKCLAEHVKSRMRTGTPSENIQVKWKRNDSCLFRDELSLLGASFARRPEGKRHQLREKRGWFCWRCETRFKLQNSADRIPSIRTL
jgi:hypothetical protein